MALIVCKECGKEFSDKADKCPNCGCPIAFSQASSPETAPDVNPQPTPAGSVAPAPTTAKQEPNKKNSKLAVTGFILSLIFCLPIFPLVGLILCIIALRNKSYKNGLAKAGIIISIIAFVLGAYILGNSGDESTTTSASTESTSTAEVSTEVASNSVAVDPTTTEEPTPEPTPAETKEEFIASCEEPDYKTLARYPDENIGKRIKLKVKINQVLQGGLFDNNEYYRVYTDTSGYDLYLDDEYFMYDERIDDDTKLLESDIIEVYGEFSGTETVTRALTGTKEDVPSFKAYYIDIIE